METFNLSWMNVGPMSAAQHRTESYFIHTWCYKFMWSTDYCNGIMSVYSLWVCLGDSSEYVKYMISCQAKPYEDIGYRTRRTTDSQCHIGLLVLYCISFMHLPYCLRYYREKSGQYAFCLLFALHHSIHICM